MGIFTGFKNGEPWGLQMGETGQNPRELDWGPEGQFGGRSGAPTEYYRYRR
jgi:hypothetical protein